MSNPSRSARAGLHRVLFSAIAVGSLGSLGAGCGPSTLETVLDHSTTNVAGTLGDLGPAQPMVSSLMIENSGETLVYLSTTQLSCNGLTISRWLGQTPPEAQVIEVVLHGTAAVSTFDVPPNEVNYAKGGRSSAFEVVADSGQLNVVTARPGELVEGDFDVFFGADEVTGSFHATFCDGGQGY